MRNFFLQLVARAALNWGPIKEWFNKDVRGAIAVILAILAIGFVLMGCSVSPAYRPRLEAGLAVELDKDKPVMGRDPVGVARVRQPLYFHNNTGIELFAEYLHLSSIPDEKDKNTVDQAALMFSIPLGKFEPRCRY